MTDKGELGYTPAYERIAADWYDQAHRVIRILEIGVCSGSGMRWLAEIFGVDESTIHGVDIGPEAGYPDQQDRIIIGRQEDPAVALVASKWAPWDLIVDDASHLGGPTSVCLKNFWPMLAPGGVYVIEDWNFIDATGNAANLWQMLLGGFMAFPVSGNPRTDHPYSGVLPDVESVELRNGMIITRRAV